MFQLINNAKSREIIAEISLEDFINSVKNPDFTRKSQINFARTLDRKDNKYYNIKTSLPCIVFNYEHTVKVNSSTRIKSTGYFYIDVDNLDTFDFSKHNFIVCAWKSLSNKGYGILCKVSGVTLDNYKEVAKQLAEEIGIEYDSAAVSSDRLCVLPYDESIYINNKVKEYVYINKKSDTQPYMYINNKVGLDVTFSQKKESGKIRTSNLNDIIKDIDFNGELFLDLKDEKLEYAQVFVPFIIPVGKRNAVMFPIVSQIYGLNSWMDEGTLLKYTDTINQDKFHPPLSPEEIKNIVNKVMNKEAKIITNMRKRFLFNPDYCLSGNEKRIIAVSNINKIRGEETFNNITNLLNTWDFDNLGKITQIKISKIINKSSRTVKRHFSTIKEEIKLLNLEYKNLVVK